MGCAWAISTPNVLTPRPCCKKSAQGKVRFDRESRLAVPVFFNTRLISVVDEEPTILAFLKYEDMAKTWDTMILETRKAVKGSKGFASKGTEANPESLVS